MRNASKAVRDSYYSALNGNITYNGQDIHVYKESPMDTPYDHYIVLGSIDETNDPNDAKFVRNVTITIDVVTRHYRYRTYDTVDDISEQITQIILANIGGLLQDQYFQIGHIQNEFAQYLEGTSGERLVTRKILQFTQTLIQY